MRGTVVRMLGLAASAALAGCACAGCSVLQPQSMRIDSATAAYQGVTITYRVDGGQLNEPLTVARIDGQQVTQQSVPSSPYPDRSVARLSIRYPHPDGKADSALAELVIETRKPPGAQAKKSTWQQWVDSFAATARDVLPGVRLSDDVHEAWAMDIAKSDLDRVIAGMQESGYLVNPSKATLGVELAAHIDNFQANKRWSREPELDVLMDRVRQKGQLVSYVHPVESNRASTFVAAGTPARFVSQGEEGPSLMPAGPQNNAYANPPESRAPARAPQYTPPPTTYTPYTPPPSTPALVPAPPAAPTTAPSYPPRSGMPNLLRPPAARPSLPPAEAQAPAPRATGPQSKRPANSPAKPNSRWQYPPQFRRQPGQPPGSLGPNAAGPNANGPVPAMGPAAPQGAARSLPQQPQQRLPWRRPAAQDAQQPMPALPSANAAKTQAAPRSRLQRNPAIKGQQPPAAGRSQPRYPPPPGNQPPPRYPSTPYGSAQNDSSPAYPQTSTPSSDGSPPGIPQPPQLGSRPSNTY